jgi:hypothetical protein
MALIKCPECGRDVSDTCKQCIHCGFDLTNVKNALPEKPIYEFYIFIFFKSRMALYTIGQVQKKPFTISASKIALGAIETTLNSNLVFGDLIHVKCYKKCLLLLKHSSINGETRFVVEDENKYGADKPKVYILDIENRPFSQAIKPVPEYLQDYEPGKTAAPSLEIVVK